MENMKTFEMSVVFANNIEGFKEDLTKSLPEVYETLKQAYTEGKLKNGISTVPILDKNYVICTNYEEHTITILDTED